MQINLYGEARRTEKIIFFCIFRGSQSKKVAGKSSKRVQGEAATKTKQIPWHRQMKSIRECKGLSSALLYKPSNRLHRCKCQQSMALCIQLALHAAMVVEGSKIGSRKQH